MKVVTIKQGGRDWHDWRGKGLGASDSPAVMGESPWTSRFQLWGEKCGLLTKPPFSPWQQAAVDRGVKLEPEARDWYQNFTGKICQPLAGEHDTHTFVRASFDGITDDLKHFIEIKCPGKEAHEQALKGQVPSYYWPQIQHQYLVSGAATMDYVSYRDGEGVIVPVQPDLAYQSKLLAELRKFWDCIQTLTPPELSRTEFRQLLDKAKKDLEQANNAVAMLERAWRAVA